MHVAKYWRNRKLRYQLKRKARRPRTDLATEQSQPPGEVTRELQPIARRAKAVA